MSHSIENIAIEIMCTPNCDLSCDMEKFKKFTEREINSIAKEDKNIANSADEVQAQFFCEPGLEEESLSPQCLTRFVSLAFYDADVPLGAYDYGKPK